MPLLTPLFRAALLSLIFLLIYLCVQQTYRSSANDPQLQLARDLSRRIARSGSWKAGFPTDTVDISQSLAPFMMVYDAMGRPLLGSGRLDGQVPLLPQELFEYTRLHGEDQVTWQRRGMRMALVLEAVPAPGQGFVAAARSLKEVEIREENLGKTVAIAWAAALLLLGASEWWRQRWAAGKN